MADDDLVAINVDKLYEQLNTNIRATDEISFKLLGLVPLVSGAAIGTLLFKDVRAAMGLSPELIILFCLFAAAITLGLFRWELRNVQECGHLITLAEAVASHRLAECGVPLYRQARPPRPQGIGKTEAEKIIYLATIGVWLAFPLALGAVSGARTWALVSYCVLGATIFVLALLSFFARTRPKAPAHT